MQIITRPTNDMYMYMNLQAEETIKLVIAIQKNYM